MARFIKSMEEKYLLPSLELVEQVFTEHENAAEGRLVRHLVEEIRRKPFYLPELELLMVNDADEPIGYVMFSRFHLEGRYENELLILTPAAVRTDMQRRHISKELIEHGFRRAVELGYKAVIVEGNPQNYHARGFVTAADHGILPGETVHLPHISCLMVKELVPGGLEGVHGKVEYSDYETLQ
ncbi:MAG: N-acetyltransferase [Clostridiales bacterium]|nr:N-acetyltransferase [Clostridiales bacterium]